MHVEEALNLQEYDGDDDVDDDILSETNLCLQFDVLKLRPHNRPEFKCDLFLNVPGFDSTTADKFIRQISILSFSHPYMCI